MRFHILTEFTLSSDSWDLHNSPKPSQAHDKTSSGLLDGTESEIYNVQELEHLCVLSPIKEIHSNALIEFSMRISQLRRQVSDFSEQNVAREFTRSPERNFIGSTKPQSADTAIPCWHAPDFCELA